ncbi:MAG: TetR family transcriptional regulator [Actinomycetota bacterium]
MTRNPRVRHRAPDPRHADARAQRREELLEAADRIVRRDGPRASMTEIAAAAGVTKPILYKHFGDKGGLYRALAERYVHRLLDELRSALARETRPRARLETTIATYVSFVDREREAYGFLMHRAIDERSEAQAAVADFIHQLGQELTIVLGEELRKNGVDSAAAEPWAHGIVGLVHLAADRWLEHPSMPRDRLVEYLTALLWDGLAHLPAQPALQRDAG